MIKFEKRVIKKEYEQQHIAGIKEFLERNISGVLSGKSETGSKRSEWGYQLTAASVSGTIARVIGCDETKAKALSLAVGVYFPKYGHEGLKAVKQYITEHEIDLNIDCLEVTAICYYISNYYYQHTHPVAVNVFYDLINDYFCGIDSCEEIKIVHLVQDTIRNIKKAEHFYEGYPGDLLNEVSKELVTLAKEHIELKKSRLLERYQKEIAAYKYPELTEQEYKDVYESLDSYVEEFTNLPKGLEDLKKTPEEAVLIYLYLEH